MAHKNPVSYVSFSQLHFSDTFVSAHILLPIRAKARASTVGNAFRIYIYIKIFWFFDYFPNHLQFCCLFLYVRNKCLKTHVKFVKNTLKSHKNIILNCILISHSASVCYPALTTRSLSLSLGTACKRYLCQRLEL